MTVGVRVKRSLRRPVRSPLALALLLASGAASALGLGQIELKSKIGEPLVAEIPVISSDPSELEQLRAGMPSRETFARIGMQEPDALVSSLRYSSALDARGRPVIRVTSDQPINEPLLTFLVEVDWGQGRLVREYSALIAPPRTVAAPLQPPIEAPQAAPSNTIVREPAAPAAPVSRPAPAPAARPAAPAAAVPRPTPAPVAVAPAPVPVAPAPRPAASPTAPRDDALTLRVRPGQSLSEIASGLRGEVSLEQAMVALLRANPDAFIDGDINQLKRGAVLRVPARADLGGVDAGQASELVRTQVERWQLARRPIATPDAPAPTPTRVTPPAATPTASARPAPAARPAVASASPAPPAAAPPRSRARLEIVPPGASNARQSGTQSGLAASGGGQMLRQELEQAQETVVARDAELAEMKARVAELESLQKQQSQLITLKDSQLAAAQQRLQQAEQATPQAAPVAWWPWVGGALVLLVAGLLLAWAARRRAEVRAFRVPKSDTPPSSRPSLADTFADGVTPATRPPAQAPVPSTAAPTPAPAPAALMAAAAAMPVPGNGRAKGRGARAKDRAHPDAPVAPATTAGQPAAPGSVAPAPVPAPAAPVQRVVDPAPVQPVAPAVFAAAPALASAPTWHATTRAGVTAKATPGHGVVTDPRPAMPAAVTAPDPAPEPGTSTEPPAGGGNERLELARAYLDLGDQASARQLLVELVVNGDHASRQQASKLLRDLD